MKVAVQPWIVVVSHVIPAASSAGNELRIERLLRHLKKRGFRVALILRVLSLTLRQRVELNRLVDRVFLLPHGLSLMERAREGLWRVKMAVAWRCGFAASVKPDHLRQFVRAPGMDDHQASRAMKDWFCPPALTRCVQKVCNKLAPVVVIAEYIFSSPCLRNLPGRPLRLIDTIDVFSRIKTTVHAHGIQDLLACSPEEERCYLLDCDVIMAIQPEEAELLKTLAPERQVITVGMDFDIPIASASKHNTAPRLLAVGGIHPRNIHGMEVFLQECWPLILQAMPGCILRICGAMGERISNAYPNIEKAGVVADLGPEYHAADLVVCPILAGTGVKVKVVEALAHGKAVITTPHGAEGIQFPDGSFPCLVADGWPRFAADVVQLLMTGTMRQELEARAEQYAIRYLSEEVAYHEMDNVLSRIEFTHRHDQE